jgi:HD-GYP domain-containing protein (c-di-GMP phosphodiesterase class II)
MANILIWGDLEEIIPGVLPTGISAVEARRFDELVDQVRTATPALILASVSQLERESDAIRRWKDEAGLGRPWLIGVGPTDALDALIAKHPYLDDTLTTPVTARRLQLRLERVAEARRDKADATLHNDALTRSREDLHELNAIGVALSSERDIDKLLDTILRKSREITAADAGSLYLVEKSEDGTQQLRFKLTQNDSVDLPFAEYTMPLTETSIAGHAALTGKDLNIADVYHLPEDSPFPFSRAFDEKSGYRTKSMLVVPMKDHRNEVIGVVQLINKKRNRSVTLDAKANVDAVVLPFTAVDDELVTSLTSQAAVAFENTLLIQNIKHLFDSFVKASVTAIESRDPTTSGHSERVAVLTVGLAETVDRSNDGMFANIRFGRDEMQEIRYASLLHDFGKVGVREKVLIKGKKLYVGEMLLIKQRFDYIMRTHEAGHLRAKLDAVTAGTATPEQLLTLDREYEQKRVELEQLFETVRHANQPSVLEEESARALLDLPNRSYYDPEGQRQPLLTPNEVSALSIRRGSLSDKERREIESHVTHTFRFLSQIPWTGEYRRIPEIAYAHHEKLDGTGYPRHLKAEDIPVQSKMMTIADIYDALVAWDRPYKKAVPIERALSILGDEAHSGKLDRELLALFIDAKLYEKTLRESPLLRQQP